MKDKRIDIRMIVPCDEWKRPVAPLNYLHWLFNTKGYANIVLRFLDYSLINFDEWDKFLYIKYRNEEFLRYDIDKDIIYIWKDGGTEIKKVSEFLNYCKEQKIRILVEEPGKCTYGL